MSEETYRFVTLAIAVATLVLAVVQVL